MLLCPFCEAELKDSFRKEGGWDCPCGEFIPCGLACDTEASCGCKGCRKD